MSFRDDNSLFSKSKDLYNKTIVDYSETVPEQGYHVISKEDLENKYLVEFYKRIDTYAELFSTQQIFNLDWDKFENHVFFDSAIGKVNYVFSTILQEFPWEGTRDDYVKYIRRLDGYTNYILKEKYPQSYNSIYLGENYIDVIDKPGSILKPYLDSEKGFLNPRNRSFNFDFWLNLNNNIEKDYRVIFQKIDTDNNVGFTAYINNSSENTLNFLLTNYRNEYLKSSIDVSSLLSKEKYTFSETNTTGYFHISISVNPVDSENTRKQVVFYVNGKKIKSITQGSFTSEFIEINNNLFNNANFLLGNGYGHAVVQNSLLSISDEQISGLDGLIDEFRFFHKHRDVSKIVKEKDETIFSQDGLKLYLKFNEPAGLYSNNFLNLDASGNKLHGQIKSSTTNAIIVDQEIVSNLRKYKSAPMFREKDVVSPVIFPGFVKIKELQSSLLLDADKYDEVNPNIIFNLFPKNSFLEGSDFENLSNIFSNKNLLSEGDELSVNFPANQTFVNMLLVWARFFDELKCYIDNLSEVINTDYDDLNQKSPFGIIIPMATKMMGFKFKNLFPSPSVDKLDGYNFSHSDVKNSLGLRRLQNEIWKRILINSQDFIRSKGTVNSIKSIFNSVGIEADKFVDIKEYNGKNKLNFSESNRIVSQNIKYLDFGQPSTFFEENTITDNIPDHKIRLSSDFILNQFSNVPATTGNFTYEGYYRFNEIKRQNYDLTQALCLLNQKSDGFTLFEPVIYVSFQRLNYDDEKGKLIFEIQTTSSELDYQKIEIDDVSLLNGETWHISYGRRLITSPDIWENFLYVRQAGNKKYLPYKLSTQRQKLVDSNTTVFTEDNPLFVSIGLRPFNEADPGFASKPTLYEGELANVRFYNTDLTLEELLQRSNDITYYGFKDALDKRKLVLNIDLSESFEIDSVQYDDLTDSNFIHVNDKSIFNVGKQAFTRNTEIANNNQDKLFTENTRLKGIIVTRNTPEYLISSIKRRNILILKNDIRFDDVFSSEKIKINSLQNPDLAKLNNNIVGNVSNISPDMTQFNQARISIEHSNVKYLNQDISKMIGSFEFLSNAYGMSSNIYDSDYLDIKAAREIYFEKMFKEIDFKPMQQLFKYFDNILTDLLEQSIPSKINYQGFNYVYESHALERHKYEYKMSECRIPIEDEGNEFSRPVINSPRTEKSLLARAQSPLIRRGETN